jgi:hypothetical protein
LKKVVVNVDIDLFKKNFNFLKKQLANLNFGKAFYKTFYKTLILVKLFIKAYIND